MFSTARVDRAVMPATNSRSTKQRGVPSVFSITMASHRGSDIEADENAIGVREIADDLAHGLGKPAHERRHREDLIAGGQLRILDQVDDLDPIPPGQMLLADSLQIRERGDRSRRLPSDVQAQDLAGAVAGRRPGRAGKRFSGFHSSPFLYTHVISSLRTLVTVRRVGTPAPRHVALVVLQ